MIHGVHIKKMNSLGPAIALIVLLAAGPARAEELPGGYLKQQIEIETKEDITAKNIEAWIWDIDAIFRLNRDPVLRAIICRVPYMDFTIESIAWATKFSLTRIQSAVVELRNMGLVIAGDEHDGDMLIRPESTEARAIMRHWAEDWCDSSDAECAVAR